MALLLGFYTCKNSRLGSFFRRMENETHYMEEFNTVVEKIKNLIKDGKKIYLFVGRTLEERMPKEKEVVWVSLDQYKFPSYEENSFVKVEDRLHLHMDMNDLEKMKKLKGLFDRIVFDPSVIRSFFIIVACLQANVQQIPLQ